MSPFIYILIKQSVPEEQLIAILNDAIPEGVESLDYPRESATLFVQCLEHDAPFQQSAGLSWASGVLQLDDIWLAGVITKVFKTEVLLEPRTLSLPGGYKWCLVTQSQQLYAVETIDVDDGIALRHDAPRLPIKR